MGPFRGPYRGSPLRDPCWWAVSTEVAAHWEEVLMGLFRGGTHTTYKEILVSFISNFMNLLSIGVEKSRPLFYPHWYNIVYFGSKPSWFCF